MKSPSFLLLITSLAASGPFPLAAQQGDREGHVMKPPPAHWKIPPAPVVPADQAARTMTLEEGFELELVASEPLVQDPVALAFDGEGRIWVAEMLGYMPDIDGKLEDSTPGRISVLEDRDGDGIPEKATVFLENYLLPRAVALTDADRTLLFADNLKLYQAEILVDTDGSIRAGKVEVIDEAFAEGGNPEHKSNGLLRALDNWIYNAKCDRRYRKVGGSWVQEPTEERGQWGIVQDNQGRLLTNTNSNLVSVEEVPPGVRVRNPHYTFRSKVVSTVKDQSLWPGRINPGVNRGYMEGTLDERGYLQKPTAVSGLALYRGDQFPERYRGNLFVPEPSGNLVKRLLVEDSGAGTRVIKSALQGREFLTSTDERSRIVNVHDAPDGSLYLVDLYRGILQHRVYMTSYLRAQVEERGLDRHIHLGRLWRIRHREGRKESERPHFSGATAAELVGWLSHPNGWWRDTAQRFLVERGGEEALPLLRELAAGPGDELGSIHALWTLEGLGRLDPDTVAGALSRPQPRVVAEAIRAAEGAAASPLTDEVFAKLADFATSTTPLHPAVRRQLAATLGRFGERSVPVLASLLTTGDSDLLTEDLAVSGLSGHELALFRVLPASHPLRAPLVETLVKRNLPSELEALNGLVRSPKGFAALARSSTALRRTEEVVRLIERVADEKTSPEIRKALVGGMVAGGKDKKFKALPVKELGALDRALEKGAISPEQHRQVAALFKVGTGEEEVFLLTEAHRTQFKEGEIHYQRICLGCHQAHGNGQQFLAPPLVGSEWVLQSEKRLIALVLDGIMGPIEVLGKTYTVPEIQPLMPGLRASPEFTDEQLAAILTYVRNAWGNGAPPVTAEAVANYRRQVAPRAPWTPEELKKLK